jgi:transposase
MSARFVNVDRETPMLLPVDLRDWVPQDDMVHFVLEAVEGMAGKSFEINHRGSGSAQYPPRMMAALLVYCYSQGVFASRAIERATYHNIAVRYLTGNTHPDHDTICAFRRKNKDTIKELFAHLTKLAREMGVLKVGTVSIDGTHIKANASKHQSVRYDRAVDLEAKLEADIEELLRQAEEADEADEEDGNRLPEEIARLEALRQKMEEARQRLEQRAQQEQAEAEPAREDVVDEAEPAREDAIGEAEPAREDAIGEAEPAREDVADEEDPPKDREGAVPRPEQQINLTDPDSALMRKSRRHGWEQAYNAQVVVDADGSQLVLAEHVSRSPSDAGELEWAWKTMSEEDNAPQRILGDAGYASRDRSARSRCSRASTSSYARTRATAVASSIITAFCTYSALLLRTSRPVVGSSLRLLLRRPYMQYRRSGWRTAAVTAALQSSNATNATSRRSRGCRPVSRPYVAWVRAFRTRRRTPAACRATMGSPAA